MLRCICGHWNLLGSKSCESCKKNLVLDNFKDIFKRCFRFVEVIFKKEK